MNDASDTPSPKPSRSFNLWMVLAIVALAVVAWQWMETRIRLLETQQEVAQHLAQAENAAKEDRAAVKDAAEQIAALQARAGTLEARLAEFQSQTTSLQAVYQDLARARDESALLEVEQAVNLAAQQLQFAGNVSAALLALQAADARLVRLDRPQFAALRKAISHDVERLRALPVIDLAGMSLKLENIVQAADRLALARDERLPTTRESVVAGAPSPWWQRMGGALWQEIKGLVRIQRLDREEPVLLAPGQAFFLRENLKLRLLNARLALLSRDQALFRGEIQGAQDWLGRHFDGRDKNVQQGVATLRQLGSAELSIALPNLNESLAALRAARSAKGGK